MEDMTKLQDTAYYVFDWRILRRRVAYLQGLLGSNVNLAYAIKANPFLVDGVRDLVARLEICSPGESYICDGLGIDPKMTVISGVNKTPAFIEELVSSTDGRIYTVESLHQFELLEFLSRKYEKRLTVLLRLTNDSQFGINEEDIEQIIAARDTFGNLHIQGIQFFSGTQKTSLKKLKREISHLDGFLGQLEEKYGWHSPELEYGTGFPVAYFGEDLEEEALILGFRQLLEDMTWQGEITLELGRSIAASCGRFFTHVVDKKRNHGQNYLIVDGGMHQMVYYGQYMGMKIPQYALCGREGEAPTDTWNVFGSLCSMNDILVKALPLPEPEIGDTLRFDNTGAYCVTEGIALFLSRDLPAVYIIDSEGKLFQARKTTETFPFNTIHTSERN